MSGLWPRRPRYGSSRARVVGDRCPDVAEVEWSCGRWHSGRCPHPPACCRAPVGRCQVVLGTFLHAVGVWEGALDVLPGSSGVLPGSPWLLPDRSRTFPVSSRQLPAPVLHTIIPIHTRHPAPARRERGAGRVERVARRIRVGRSPSAFGERMARLRERVPLRQGTYRWPGGVGVGPPRQVQRLPDGGRQSDD